MDEQLIPLDVTTAGLVPEGVHQAIVDKIVYERKVGEKFNKEGTVEVSFEEMLAQPLENDLGKPLARAKIGLKVTKTLSGESAAGKYLFNELYMSKSSAGFVKSFFDAAGVSYSRKGLDPRELANREVIVKSAIIEEKVRDKDTGEETGETRQSNAFTFSKV